MNSPINDDGGPSYRGRNHKDKKAVYISEASMNQYQISASKPVSTHNSAPRRTSKSASPKKPQETTMFLTGIDPNESSRSSQIEDSPPQTKASPPHMVLLKLQKSNMDTPPKISAERKPNLYVEIENKFSKHYSSPHIEHSDPKWMEFKIIGRNIPSRSRSAIAVAGNYLYIYGGYELTLGSIQDFWRININTDQYIWEKVPVRGKLNPGPKSRMAYQTYKDKFYLFGGLSGSSRSSNEMWCFDFKQETWSLVNSSNSTEKPTSIDSHSSVLIGTKMYILFGYLSESAQMSNAVFSFDFERSTWQKLFDVQAAAPSSIPKPRLETAIATVASQPDLIYVFGGTDGFYRMNDLWTFNIKTKQYTEIITKPTEIPMVRSGHQLFSIGDHIAVLGGLHDITWELDDLHVFDVKNSVWKVINGDTARRRDKTLQSPSPDSKKGSGANNFPNRTRKRGQTTSFQSPLRRMQSMSPQKPPARSSVHSLSMIGGSNYEKEHHSVVFENESPSQASLTLQNSTKLAEKRRKDFLVRKANMLQTFEVVDPTEAKFRDLSPTSQAMKDSLVGNPMPSIKVKAGKLTDFGRTSISRFLEPLSVNGSTRSGKRPCARDGHRVTFTSEGNLIVFGGDRHNMSFHDIYQLNITMLKSSLFSV